MNAPARFRQSELTRVLKAARAAGLDDVRVEIEPDGKIVIMAGRLAELGERNPWDED